MNDKKVPQGQIKRQTLHERIATILVLIVLPITSSLVICAGKQSALYNSLSRLAWPEGLLWLVYLWGILPVGCFIYSMELALRAGEYSKRWKKTFLSMEIVSAALLGIGIGIPAYIDRGELYLTLRTVHTAICAVGFFGFFVTLIVFSITLFMRNKRQGLFSLCFNGFTLIVGVFFMVKVSDPSSYCHVSAPAQILLFELYCLHALLNYYSMVFIPKEEKKEEKCE